MLKGSSIFLKKKSLNLLMLKRLYKFKENTFNKYNIETNKSSIIKNIKVG